MVRRGKKLRPTIGGRMNKQSLVAKLVEDEAIHKNIKLDVLIEEYLEKQIMPKDANTLSIIEKIYDTKERDIFKVVLDYIGGGFAFGKRLADTDTKNFIELYRSNYRMAQYLPDAFDHAKSLSINIEKLAEAIENNMSNLSLKGYDISKVPAKLKEIAIDIENNYLTTSPDVIVNILYYNWSYISGYPTTYKILACLDKMLEYEMQSKKVRYELSMVVKDMSLQ